MSLTFDDGQGGGGANVSGADDRYFLARHGTCSMLATMASPNDEADSGTSKTNRSGPALAEDVEKKAPGKPRNNFYTGFAIRQESGKRLCAKRGMSDPVTAPQLSTSE